MPVDISRQLPASPSGPISYPYPRIIAFMLGFAFVTMALLIAF